MTKYLDIKIKNDTFKADIENISSLCKLIYLIGGNIKDLHCSARK
jgi:hypothetical protein